ncbi:MAG TPA: BamA/TamA family outer membrane protein [Gemmatimonadales bacterium]|nr:BamA/TamA family outer membrane protein [Gemmatimonadales bacterium]
MPVLLMAGVAFARPAEAQGGDVGERVVRRLAFEGNHAYGNEELAAVIATTSSGWFATSPLVRWMGLGEKRYFDELEFRRDVLRLIVFYREGGFLDVQVDTLVRRDPRDVYVTFKITEGAPTVVDSFRIGGLDGYAKRNEVVQDLPLEEGKPFDRRVMLATADTIVERLLNRGYPSAQVFRNFNVDQAARRAEVSFDVVPGPYATFGPVRVRGASQVDTALIRKLLAARPGREYRQQDLYESQSTLYRTEMFRFVGVGVDTTRFTPGDTTVPVRVQVNEGDFRRVRAGIGYGTNDCVRLGAGWTARNWLGGGRLFDLSGKVSKVGVGAPLNWGFGDNICHPLAGDSIGSSLLNYSAAASLRTPAFFDPYNTATYSLFAERRSEFEVYRREEQGVSFGVARVTPRHIPITLTYRLAFGQTVASAGTFCAFFRACTAADVDQLRERRRLATLTATFAWPRTNSPLDPTRGWNGTLELTHSSRYIGSSPLEEFSRVVAELSWYRPLARNVVLSWRLRGGLLTSPKATFDSSSFAFVPPEQRFYAGGPNDVRGYDQNEMGPVVYVAPDSLIDSAGNVPPGKAQVFPTGGNTLVVGNVELRLPSPIFSSRVRWAVFVDAGLLYERENTASAPRLIRVTPGFGLRIATPLGPARLDVAYNGYDRPPGALYGLTPQGDLLLRREGFTQPRTHGYTIHVAVGQPF